MITKSRIYKAFQSIIKYSNNNNIIIKLIIMIIIIILGKFNRIFKKLKLKSFKKKK